MGKRKYTTAIGKNIIEHYYNQLKWVTDCIYAKSLPIENQTEYVQTRSIDYFVGVIVGTLATVDYILMRENCYYGFDYMDGDGNIIYPENGKSITEHPDYIEWRVKFIVKEKD